MKIFLSWSGARSKQVADILFEWLPTVIQSVEPWMSVGLDKGSRWQSEIAARLEEAKFSIICLTRDNLKAPWILFEAGALSKTSNSNVCTFLFDVSHNDVEFPLAQFQHTSFEREDVRRLLHTVNHQLADSGERALTEAVLEKVFVTYWPHLEERLKAVAASVDQPNSPVRTSTEMMEEVLELVRLLVKTRVVGTFGLGEVGVPLIEGLLRSAGFPTTWPSEAERKGITVGNAMIGSSQLRKYLSELRAVEAKAIDAAPIEAPEKD